LRCCGGDLIPSTLCKSIGLLYALSPLLIFAVYENACKGRKARNDGCQTIYAFSCENKSEAAKEYNQTDNKGKY